MKKLLAILMCMMMLCVGAYAEDVAAATPDVTGEWKLDSIEAMGMVLSPSMMGMEMIMTLNADGIAQLKTNGEVEEGIWSQDGVNLIIDGQAFTYADGKITGTEESMGATMYFVRPDAEVAPALPEVIADAALADFNGAWTLTAFGTMGMELPVAMMGVGMDMEILDGAIILTFAEMDAEGNMESLTMPEALMGEFANGTLTLAVPGMEMEIALQLRTDGRMFFGQEQDGVVVEFLFDKVVAE